MRLIDADALIQMLRHDIDCYGTGRPDNQIYINAKDVADMVNGQPTAYDVDKVVERLEELAACAESKAAEYDEAGKIERMNIHDGKAAAYKNTIRIVKSGGIE